MTDRLRAPLFRSTGEPDVQIARVRCLAVARALKAGIELAEKIAGRTSDPEIGNEASAWAAFQRDRFDIPRS